MFTHETALATLDAEWSTLRRTRDLPWLRDRALKAITFAICSVHTPVAQSEWEFAEYIANGVLSDGTMLGDQKASALKSAERWIETTTVETFDVDGWTLAETILANVYGLGTAKSAFAAALCGNPEPYCIDTHGAALIAARTGAEQSRIVGSIKADKGRGERAIAAAWRRYRAWGDTTFGARNHQWEFFALKVPEFRDGGHAAYFTEAILGLTAA